MNSHIFKRQINRFILNVLSLVLPSHYLFPSLLTSTLMFRLFLVHRIFSLLFPVLFSCFSASSYMLLTFSWYTLTNFHFHFHFFSFLLFLSYITYARPSYLFDCSVPSFISSFLPIHFPSYLIFFSIHAIIYGYIINGFIFYGFTFLRFLSLINFSITLCLFFLWGYFRFCRLIFPTYLQSKLISYYVSILITDDWFIQLIYIRTYILDMESIDSLAKAINQFTGGMVLVSHDMRLISQVISCRVLKES